MSKPNPAFWIALDAGGTMTDTVIVEPGGRFLAGKALTNKRDEAESFLSSIRDAAASDGKTPRDIFPYAHSTVYAGTILLNTLLSHTGANVGLLITQGLEDYLMMEKAEGAWLGYGYSDQLHTVTHQHQPPVIPRNRIRGVQERIDMFGTVVIPINVGEIREQAQALVGQGAEVLAVMFMFAHLNPVHEQEVRRAIQEILPHIPVVLSSDMAPTHKEYTRLATVVAQAYTAERAREQFYRVDQTAKEQGFIREVATLLAHGGTAPISHPRIFESYASGPIGGVMGGQYVGEILGDPNAVCCDVGGTSFDVGIIRDGRLPIAREPQLLSYRTNLPMVLTQSIGAGMGSELGVDPLTAKLAIGPKSAGSDVGVCYRYPQPTVTDCHVVLGYVNPDYFLGGDVKLDVDRASQALEPLAKHFHVSVGDFAEGATMLLHDYMYQHLHTMLRGRGYDPSDYVMFMYGGGGPLELYGLMDRIRFKDTITFPFAAVFSAFGALCAPTRYRYHQSIVAAYPPTNDSISRQIKIGALNQINEAWQALEQRAQSDFAQHGWDFSEARLTHYAYVRYTNQLSDFEVPFKSARLQSLDDLALLMKEFEHVYTTIYPKQALYSELGYQILEVALVAELESPRPQLPIESLAGPTPPSAAEKGIRKAHWHGESVAFRIYEMDEIRAGNCILGPAIVEHPATTLLVAPGWQARFDERRLIHYEPV